MKKEVLTISQRGELAEQMKSAKHFYLDLKLFNEHFPASKMSVKFTKVNEHNMDSLHGQMLYELLNKVDQDDILNNRMTPLELANKKKADIKAAKEAKKQAKEDAKSDELKAIEDAAIAAELKAKEDAAIVADVTNVTIPEETHEAVKSELEDTRDELETVQSDLDEANDTIEDLQAEKKSESPDDLNKPNSQE